MNVSIIQHHEQPLALMRTIPPAAWVAVQTVSWSLRAVGELTRCKFAKYPAIQCFSNCFERYQLELSEENILIKWRTKSYKSKLKSKLNLKLLQVFTEFFTQSHTLDFWFVTFQNQSSDIHIHLIPWLASSAEVREEWVIVLLFLVVIFLLLLNSLQHFLCVQSNVTVSCL